MLKLLARRALFPAVLCGSARFSLAEEEEEAGDAPSLREWLGRGKLALGISQGFGCEFQSVGAVLGLCDGLGGQKQLRDRLEAVSGASSGAKVAALAAMHDVDIEQFSQRLLALGLFECFFPGWAHASPPWRGGYLSGSHMIDFLRANWGADRRIETMAIPFGSTAFDLGSWRSVDLVQGDIAAACQASGAFPGLFAPLRVPTEAVACQWKCQAPTRLLTDCAFFSDAAGLRGLAQAPSRRILQIANADWNLRRWLVVSPSDLPARVANAEVVSLVLTGQARVLPTPGFHQRTRAALDGARKGVAGAMDRPMTRGAEPGHYICVVDGGQAFYSPFLVASITALTVLALCGGAR